MAPAHATGRMKLPDKPHIVKTDGVRVRYDGEEWEMVSLWADEESGKKRRGGRFESNRFGSDHDFRLIIRRRFIRSSVSPYSIASMMRVMR